MRKTLLLLIILVSTTLQAQNFEEYFTDKTLRLDYIFSGTKNNEYIALDQLNQLPKWVGRRTNLEQLGRDGNGQINVFDAETKRLIYKESFSSLFQEWQTIDEAKHLQRSFENTFLIPYPKSKIVIEISLRNKKGEYESKIQHIVDPEDILIRKKGIENIPNYSVIHQGGAIENAINVAIVAEGFTEQEMPKFREYAKMTCEEMFKHQAFSKFRNRFNFYAVETVSRDSGVAVPRENKWTNTTVSSHFDTFYSDRYLTTSNVKDLHDVLAGIPYTHIIILANTDVYGGGGIYNSYTLTTTGNSEFKPVVVHEFGHSFAGLADEYFYEGDTFDNTYPLDVEPWEPNITTLVDFDSKWKKLMDSKTPIPTSLAESKKHKVSVIEGAGYSFKGIYRGNEDCRMKTNTAKDFCPVCQSAIEDLVKFYTEQKKQLKISFICRKQLFLRYS